MGGPINLPFMGFDGVVRSVVVRRPDGSVKQRLGPYRNLILDQGLDQVAEFITTLLTAYCAVGTGDSEPDVSQTGLDDEKARTDNVLTGPGDSLTVEKDDVKNAPGPTTFTHRRTFQFAAGTLDSSVDGDYQEIGFSPHDTAGSNLFSRVLFLNQDGNPVAVSVQSDETLEVIYELVITIGPTSAASDTVEINGIGTVNYQHKVQATYGTSNNELDNARRAIGIAVMYPDNGDLITPTRKNPATPHIGEPSYPDVFVNAVDEDHGFHDAGNVNDWLSNNQLYPDVGIDDSGPDNMTAREPYTAGNYYRDIVLSVGSAEGNFEWTAITMGRLERDAGSFGNSGTGVHWVAVIDAADRFTKDDQHTLSLTIRQSWGRAA